MKKTFLIIVTFFLSLVSFEIFLEYSPFKQGVSPVEYDTELGMWHKKNFSSVLVRECYQNQYFFDSKGFVQSSSSYDEQKKDIIILGDSYIDALMVPNNKMIHNALSSVLDHKFNILNYGLTGSGPMQQWGLLKYKSSLDKIKKVIQLITLEGDLADCDPTSFNGSNRPKLFLTFSNLETYQLIKPKSYSMRERMRDFLGNFELYAYLNKTYHHYKSLFKTSSAAKVQADIHFMRNEEYRWKQLEGTLYQIKKMALKYQFEYNVLIYSSEEFHANYKKRSNRLKVFLEKENISYLNIVPFLKRLEKKHAISFECDSHWNGETHQDLAKYIQEELF